MKPKIGVLGSGKGSNLAAVCRKIETGELDAEIGLVISDVKDAGILQLARDQGVPAMWVDPGSQKGGRLSDAAIMEITGQLKNAGVELVVLAGFMKIVRGELLETFSGRMVNIHPSLLPKYKGLAAWKQALEAGESEAGCTVHFVAAGVDSGEIIEQARVPIFDGDTADTVHARIQQQEHELYSRVIGEVLRRLRAGN
ncbi:MAG: phosphoribosylglycinamide formyltransferase [Verrucomicrobia bacterium]|nr:phosphoribosylglycinamide formyltransferase [Verrucomicrobiota bacterium]